MEKIKKISRKVFYWDTYKSIYGFEVIHDVNIFGFNFIIKVVE